VRKINAYAMRIEQKFLSWPEFGPLTCHFAVQDAAARPQRTPWLLLLWLGLSWWRSKCDENYGHDNDYDGNLNSWYSVVQETKGSPEKLFCLNIWW